MTHTLINRLIGKANLDDFEKKFSIITCLAFSVVALLGVFLNIYLDIDPAMTVVALATFFIFLFLYFLGRFTQKIILLKWLISIFSLVLINFFWLYNFNSHGPSLYLFIVYFSMLLFIWDQKPVFLLFFLILTNIVILYFIEVSHPEKLPAYPSEMARIKDMYSGLIIYFALVFIFTAAAKRNYVHQYERAKESDNLKSAFLQNLSHEIRTPLNAIVGFSNLVFSENATPKNKKRYRELVEVNNHHLIRLIDDMIDLSMIQTNQFALKANPVSINATLTQEYDIFQHLLQKEKKSIDFKMKLLPEDIIIHTDGVRLEQILNNLISNAIKFTQRGVIVFGCELMDKHIRFFVSDTGIGIKAEQQENIFKRFSKASESDNFLYRGLGLGLFLSRQLVTILGGEIWVESVYGEGSTFYFTIPLKKE
ncbi:MAG: sensor histidine kinase [Bacteroidota bacterium]